MKKRFLSLFLVIVLIFSLSTNCFALSTYTVPDGTVILETVPMEYEVLVISDSVQVISDAQGQSYGGMLQYVSIGKNVQYIGANSFYGASIRTVTIPGSVTGIGANAFPSVETVTFEAGSAINFFSAGDGYNPNVFNIRTAFPNVKTVHIRTTPDKIAISYLRESGVQKIFFSDGTVWEAASPYFPDGIIKIDSHHFTGWADTLRIPDTVKSIGDYAFSGAQIERFLLGDDVEYIGSNIFGDSYNYKCYFDSVTIPSKVAFIGTNAFPSVETVTFEAGAAINLFGAGDGYNSNVFNLRSAFPNVKTVHIKTTPDKIDIRYLIESGVQKILFSDGTVWEESSPYFPDGIIKIDSYHFTGWVDTLIIPDSVKSIADYAFSSAQVERFLLGDDVEYIGSNIFGDSYNYKCYFDSVTIPSKVAFIGTNAFPSVETVTFEAGSAINLFNHGSSANSGFNLKSAFPNVKTVHIKTTPDKIDIILLEASGVETVIFSDGSVWKIGELFFPNGESAVAESRFQGYSNINKIIISDYIVTIGNSSFKNITTSGSGIPLTLGDNVSYIGAEAFKASPISSVVFGSAPLVIQDNAFAQTSIRNLNIPANVISVGNNAFNTGCLESVTLDASLLTGALNGKTFTEVFGTATNVIVKGSITEIPTGFFAGSGVSSVSYSENVVVINDEAFFGTQIKTAFIGSDVLKIGVRAFSNTQITSVNVPENVEFIGEYAFEGNSILEYAVVNGNITTLPSGIFQNCYALKNAKLPDSITEIGASAFAGCSELMEIELPKGVTTIDSNAFAGCSSLKEVVIPDGVTVIKSGTFKNCSSLEKVVIPESVQIIEVGAFEGCTKLANVNIPGAVAEIQNAAFMNCSNLSSVVVPESVETVGTDAFAGCDNLVLGGCDDSAVQAYAAESGMDFRCVNANPNTGTSFDFQNNIVYTTQSLKNDPGALLSPATDTELSCSDSYCGTGSIITITRDGVVQKYTVVVDGDVTGDSVCDVLDASMVQRFSSGYGAAPTQLELYAAGGKAAEEITVEDYSVIINKALSE